ncbi:MAG TPA: 2-oxoacid:acceptor oxidoreductase family protein, partial [Rhodospirillales bacterium]|nr:2-oxoacid:acceptor oxidoreductase family protein [Rhodospirillales bacterium]
MSTQALKKEPREKRPRRKSAKKTKGTPGLDSKRWDRPAPDRKPVETLKEHIVEIVSDSGEGAQRCGQAFGAIAARMGNGVWTAEIIPAEIQPPARSAAGASGNRIRIASHQVTNWGDEDDLIVAFNEQVLLSRLEENELRPGCIVILEDMWRTDDDPEIAAAYADTVEKLLAEKYRVYEVPMETECLKYVP